jgi:restriction system protein
MTYGVSIPEGVGWVLALLLVGPLSLVISISLGPWINDQLARLNDHFEQVRDKKQERARKDKEEKERRKEEEERQRRIFEQEEQERIRKQKQEEERRQRETEESVARARWAEFHESKTIEEVWRMSGLDFEKFLKRLFTIMGYSDVQLTAFNDYGADHVCTSPDGVKTAIQAKRYRNTVTVGIDAVYQLLGGMRRYRCPEGMVVTTSQFTEAARELAEEGNLDGRNHRITLHDGRWLEEQIKKFLPPKIPEFTWEAYNKWFKNFNSDWTSRNRRPWQ